MSSRTHPGARLLVLMLTLLAASLVAAGCGSDDSKDEGSNGAAAAESSESMEAASEDSAAEADIVDTAVEVGTFTTLVKAVQAAGLEETLRGDGPFTVFAPTDDAFAALPKGTLEELLKPENKQKLTDILTYHVASGAAVKSSDLSDGQQVDTVQGSPLTVKLDGSTAMVGPATVTKADIETSNGVIHVIDTVLMPPAK